jgi:hypothetical protein
VPLHDSSFCGNAARAAGGTSSQVPESGGGQQSGGTTLYTAPLDRVALLSRPQLADCGHWMGAFREQRKDHRFYELLEDTIQQGFGYHYLAITDHRGEVRAIQPCFTVDQDLLAGIGPAARRVAEAVRRIWPRFLKLRTLMVGCVAGEGHLDGDEQSHKANAEVLASQLMVHARSLRAPLVVLKEFPAKYRNSLECFVARGFSRIPSLPMTLLNIEYSSFDEYMMKALNSATRTKLRRKFRAAAQALPIELEVLNDISPLIDAIYPLYLQVYHRSKLHFERLTREYLCRIGQVMPDKVRFFVWRQSARPIAFTLCMLHQNALYAE